jgi:hypothetical protein
VFSPADWLAQCPYCGQPVFRMEALTGPSGGSDYDWRPWTLEDEPEPPTTLSAARRARWQKERPYRRGLACLDFDTGKWQLAMLNPRQRPISEVMYAPHWCEQKVQALYHMEKEEWLRPEPEEPPARSSTSSESASTATGIASVRRKAGLTRSASRPTGTTFARSAGPSEGFLR